MRYQLRAGIVAAILVAVMALVSAASAQTTGPDPILARSWDEIVKEARGQTVQWWLWAGDEGVNRYVDQWVAPRVQERYGVTLKRIPIKDTVEGVQKVVGEKQAGKHSGGSVDLNWISSENFLTMKQGGMLFTGYAGKFPNTRYIDWDSPISAYTAGVAVDRTAVPWGGSQWVMAYDSARIKTPPRTLAALAEWVKANPGKFTYPAPPDFTGRTFAVQALYEVTGGYHDWIQFNEDVWRQKSPALWKYLNDIKPYLWRKGETYPETIAALDQLYSSGELSLTMSSYAGVPARNVLKGVYPKSTRTLLFTPGTTAFVHYVAIPYNSSKKAGALTVIDFLMSPEAQYQKALPEVWGIGTALDMNRLSKDWVERFRNIPTPEAALDPVTLASQQVPFLHAKLVPILEKEWREQVLLKR
jgi:putative spermidine/putrescine transport system substrate-binding protein